LDRFTRVGKSLQANSGALAAAVRRGSPPGWAQEASSQAAEKHHSDRIVALLGAASAALLMLLNQIPAPAGRHGLADHPQGCANSECCEALLAQGKPQVSRCAFSSYI
jgi:hypothetical protein